MCLSLKHSEIILKCTGVLWNTEFGAIFVSRSWGNNLFARNLATIFGSSKGILHSNDHTFFTHGTGKSSSRPSWEGWISAMVWLDKKIIAGWQAAKKHRSLQLPLKENGSHISTDVLTLRRNWKTSTYSTTSTTKKPLYTTSKTNLEPENDGFHKKPVFRCFSRNPLSGSMIVPCQFSGA